jgi:hypothetical protein
MFWFCLEINQIIDEVCFGDQNERLIAMAEKLGCLG